MQSPHLLLAVHCVTKSSTVRGCLSTHDCIDVGKSVGPGTNGFGGSCGKGFEREVNPEGVPGNVYECTHQSQLKEKR